MLTLLMPVLLTLLLLTLTLMLILGISVTIFLEICNIRVLLTDTHLQTEA